VVSMMRPGWRGDAALRFRGADGCRLRLRCLCVGVRVSVLGLGRGDFLCVNSGEVGGCYECVCKCAAPVYF